MLKKAITYKDYNGTERTEDHYFNLSEAECMEMEMGTTGGLSEMIRRIVAAQDTPAIIKIFKDTARRAPTGSGLSNLMNCPRLFPKRKLILFCLWSWQPTLMRRQSL